MAVSHFPDVTLQNKAPFVATPANLPIPAFSDISKAANDVRKQSCI